jgi:hypothetical protein
MGAQLALHEEVVDQRRVLSSAFPGGVPAKRRRKSGRVITEPMEARLLMSVSCYYDSGAVFVVGDDESDQMQLTIGDNGMLALNGNSSPIPLSGTECSYVNLATVSACYVSGNGGDDYIDVSAYDFAYGCNFYLFGGLGDDSVVGTNRSDYLAGDDGYAASDAPNQCIDGRGGGDTVRGGYGDDYIFAYNGDNVNSQLGDDTIEQKTGLSDNTYISGDGGNDTLYQDPSNNNATTDGIEYYVATTVNVPFIVTSSTTVPGTSPGNRLICHIGTPVVLDTTLKVYDANNNNITTSLGFQILRMTPPPANTDVTNNSTFYPIGRTASLENLPGGVYGYSINFNVGSGFSSVFAGDYDVLVFDTNNSLNMGVFLFLSIQP